MVTMHGFFNLKNTTSELELKIAFDEFGNHLKNRQLITSFRFMRRSPDENYDSNPPPTMYYINMDFVDLAHAQKCWDYIEANKRQSTRLHQTVYSKIDDYSFFLSEDVIE
jgi:hypothetical protein